MGLFDMCNLFLTTILNLQRGRATKMISRKREAHRRSWRSGRSTLILRPRKKKIKELNYFMNKPSILVFHRRMMFKCGLSKWILFRPLLKTSRWYGRGLNRSFKIRNWWQTKAKSIFCSRMLFLKKSNKMLQKREKYSSNSSKKLPLGLWKLPWEG